MDILVVVEGNKIEYVKYNFEEIKGRLYSCSKKQEFLEFLHKKSKEILITETELCVCIEKFNEYVTNNGGYHCWEYRARTRGSRY